MNNSKDQYQTITNTCIKYIQNHLIKDRPLLVAITGDSGSGKSYYSSLIRDELNKQNIEYTYMNHDDFLISREDREPMKLNFYKDGEFSGKSKWEILKNMFRLDDCKQVMQKLKNGESAEYQPYARKIGTVSNTKVTVTPKNIIIFDTSMLLDLMDVVIMVDVDLDTIIERKIERDSDIRTPEQVEEMHRKVQGYYWSRKEPKNPNIIINNNDFNNPKIEIIHE